jgi:CRISPR/Cas system CMR subunit Cmr4 (Cas7 group RAMP superfamily)
MGAKVGQHLTRMMTSSAVTKRKVSHHQKECQKNEDVLSKKTTFRRSPLCRLALTTRIKLKTTIATKNESGIWS